MQETALLMLHLLKLLQANKNKDCGLKPFDAGLASRRLWSLHRRPVLPFGVVFLGGCCRAPSVLRSEMAVVLATSLGYSAAFRDKAIGAYTTPKKQSDVFR